MHYAVTLGTFKLNRSIYLVGRVCAAVNKPLVILCTDRLVNSSSANSLSEIFVITVLFSTIVNFDSHKSFYQEHFGRERVLIPSIDARGSYSLYISCLFFQIAIAVIGTFILLLVLGQPVGLSALGSIYLLSERVYDELQRFSVFDSRLRILGSIYSLRLTIQIFLLSLLSLSNALDLFAIVSVLIISNMSVLIGIPRVFLRPVSIRPITCVISYMSSNIHYWFISVSSVLAQQGDRVLVLVVDPQIISSYYLMSSILSLIVTAIDFFVLVPNRSKLVDKSIRSVRDIIFADSLKYSLISSVAISLLICVILSRFVSVPLYYAFLPPILLIQVSAGISLILREFNYWNISSVNLLTDEWIYVVSLFAGILCARIINMPVVAIYLLALVQFIRVSRLYASSRRFLVHP